MVVFNSPDTVDARQAVGVESVPTSSGPQTAQIGDYIVTDTRGDGTKGVRVMKESEFEAIYSKNTLASSVYGAVPINRAAAIATPTAPGAAYVQAEAQSMKTAVDAIRVALQNYGITL